MYTSVDEKLRFEMMISELCSAFVNVSADKVDDEINRWLAYIVSTLGVDRGTLFQISADHTTGLLTHTWAATKSLSLGRRSVAELREGNFELPWTVEKMLRGESVVFSSVDELPESAAVDRQFFEGLSTKSNVTIPLSVGGEVIGAIAFSSVSAETNWAEELIQRLQMVAHVFANALARKRADLDLKDAAERYRTLFESAHDALFILSGDLIVECNQHCANLFGFADTSELVGHHPWEFSPPLQSDGVSTEKRARQLRGLAEGGTPQKFAWRCRRKDESIFESEVSLVASKVSGEILLLAIVRDTSAHKQTELELKEINDRLQAERELLGEKNAALRAILTQIEEQRIEYEEITCSSLGRIFAPYLKKLRANSGSLNNKELTELEDALESIVGKGVNTFKENYASLTAREIEICELVVKGLSSKEISEALHLAPQTIHKHREVIRRKLKIQNLEINLSTYLRNKR